MTELKMTTKSTHYVNYYDLARYLGEKIGREVEIIESPNDTDYSVSIRKEEIKEYDQGYVVAFLFSGNISMEYGYYAILTYCANQGWLEEGDYVIRVSW